MSFMRSLSLAIQLATDRRDEASRQLAQAQRTQASAHDQMGQLERYAQDSENRWIGSAQVSMDPEVLRHHYQFMDRLRHAIGLQSDVLGNLQGQVELARRQLLEAETRLAGLNKVLQRKQQEELRAQERREQRQTDEFATQQYLRARRDLAHGETI